jgi:hypothetical protein
MHVTAPASYLYQPTPGPYGITLADPYDAPMVRSCFRAVPARLRHLIRARYESLWATRSRRDANLWAQDVRDLLATGQAQAMESEESLRETAQARADETARMLSRATLCTAEHVRGQLVELFARWRIPAPPAMTLAGLCARATSASWWRRQLRAHVARYLEAWARELGAVHRRAGVYLSDDAYARWDQRQRRAEGFLAAMEAVNLDTGEVVPLDEAVAGTVAEPSIRRGELMTRTRGFEEVATDLGHVSLFVTWTCPSRMHARHQDGTENPRWNGTDPRQAQAHLRALWARFRAWSGRARAPVYGLRVAEPHHDGCPHWHLLLFCAPEDADRIEARLRLLALSVDGDEAGAELHRCTVKRADPSMGTATGYMAKYLAKNVDGHRVGEDQEAAAPADSTAQRVRAWASTWGIRQFQQVGGPPVGVWRELRRLREAPAEPALFRAWEAADSGVWRAYVWAQGGPCARRRDRPVRPHSVREAGRLNAYGEESAPRVVGVSVFERVTVTRPHRWELRRRQPRGGFGVPWTRGNNCTAATWARCRPDPGGPPGGPPDRAEGARCQT